MNAVDLDLAAAGYLRSPDGAHLRYIIGLDQLVQDTQAIGAEVVWAAIGGAAACDCARRVIALNPWVFWAWPWFVRRAWSHELGHLTRGRDEENVLLWQARTYPGLVEPLVW